VIRIYWLNCAQSSKRRHGRWPASCHAIASFDRRNSVDSINATFTPTSQAQVVLLRPALQSATCRCELQLGQCPATRNYLFGWCQHPVRELLLCQLDRVWCWVHHISGQHCCIPECHLCEQYTVHSWSHLCEQHCPLHRQQCLHQQLWVPVRRHSASGEQQHDVYQRNHLSEQHWYALLSAEASESESTLPCIYPICMRLTDVCLIPTSTQSPCLRNRKLSA
jgi:hypothetical protein